MKITLIEDDVVTAVQVWVDPYNPDVSAYSWGFKATGSARRHPDDPPNRGVGRALALSRALRDLSRQLRDVGYAEAGQ